MKTIALKIFPLMVALWSLTALPASDIFQFDTTQQQQLFQRMTHEVRCLVCQNQSVAESNADFAQDIRRVIYRLVTSGESERVIRQFLVKRYGDYILFRPLVKTNTYVLWFMPLIMLIVGVIILCVVVKQRRPTMRNS